MATVLAGEVSALLVLHRLGAYGPAIRWDGLGRWLAETPPEDAIVVAVRLVALVIAWWLAASTLLYMLASAARMTTLVRGVRWATIPPLRRLVDGLLASTIVVGTTLGPAQITAARSNHGDPVVVRVGQNDVASEAAGYRPRPAGPITPESQYHPKSAGDLARSAHQQPRPSSPTNPPAASTYVVERGDSLWRIAKRRIGPSADVELVRTYWIRLIEANVHRLASGTPGLIYPDELEDLPEPASREILVWRSAGERACPDSWRVLPRRWRR